MILILQFTLLIQDTFIICFSDRPQDHEPHSPVPSCSMPLRLILWHSSRRTMIAETTASHSWIPSRLAAFHEFGALRIDVRWERYTTNEMVSTRNTCFCRAASLIRLQRLSCIAFTRVRAIVDSTQCSQYSIPSCSTRNPRRIPSF